MANGVEGPRLDCVEEEHECAEIQESQREFMMLRNTLQQRIVIRVRPAAAWPHRGIAHSRIASAIPGAQWERCPPGCGPPDSDAQNFYSDIFNV